MSWKNILKNDEIDRRITFAHGNLSNEEQRLEDLAEQLVYSYGNRMYHNIEKDGDGEEVSMKLDKNTSVNEIRYMLGNTVMRNYTEYNEIDDTETPLSDYLEKIYKGYDDLSEAMFKVLQGTPIFINN